MPEGENRLRPYRVSLTDEAKAAYALIASRSDLAAVNKVIDLLDTVPGIGHVYDPVYDAARPDFELLVVYAGRYGIYFDVDECAHEVRVYHIEDQRRDPMNRFA